MKVFVLFSILFFFNASAFSQGISFSSLLKQMPDNMKLAQFPDPFYQSLESSSYNRASTSPSQKGWFADSDGTGYIRKDTINNKIEYVIMEHQGPGCITRMWTPYFYYDLNNRKGPDVSIYIDGNKTPVIKENFIELLTGKSFIPPPYANLTTRAGVFYLPIPFSKSCKVTLDKKPFYFSIAYRAYPKGTTVKSFSKEDYKRSSDLVRSVGLALTNPGQVRGNNIKEFSGGINPDDSVTVTLPKGMHSIQSIKFKLDNPLAFGELRNILLKMVFDGKVTVWCPLGDFFCSPDTINNFHTRFMQVSDSNMICRWVMPYHSNAKIRLINYSNQKIKVSIEAHTLSWKWNSRSMYFHANWCNYGYLSGNRFFDLNFISIKGQGRIVGDILTVLSPSKNWWGEGDEKIYINEKDINQQFPSQFGTGTEDYYGWAGGVIPTGEDTFSIPFGSNVRIGNQNNPRGYNICIRNRILDDIPFKNRIKFDMEASPGVTIRHDYDLLSYSMVTYWYGKANTICNRKPAISKIKQKLMTLSTLDSLEQKLKKGQIHLDSNYINNKVRSLKKF